MKSTVITTVAILSSASAQVVTEWGRSRSSRTRRHRSLGVAHSPELFEDADVSLSFSMSMQEDLSMSMVDYYPPVEEDSNGWGGDGAIGMDADGNPIAVMSSAAGLGVSGAVLCVVGALALF